MIQYSQMLTTITEEVEKLNQIAYILQEINAQNPTQEFDQKWDNYLICPANFVSYNYNSSLGRKDQIPFCSDSDRVDFALLKQDNKF